MNCEKKVAGALTERPRTSNQASLNVHLRIRDNHPNRTADLKLPRRTGPRRLASVVYLLFSLQCKPWETFTFWNILLGGNSGKLVDVGGVSGAERGEDKSPGWG